MKSLKKIFEENGDETLTVESLYRGICLVYDDQVIIQNEIEDNFISASIKIGFEGEIERTARIMMMSPFNAKDTLDVDMFITYGGLNSDFTMSRHRSFERNSMNAYQAIQIIKITIRDAFAALKGYKEIVEYSKAQKHTIIIRNAGSFLSFKDISIVYQNNKFVAYRKHEEIASNKSPIECYKSAIAPSVAAPINEGKNNADIAEEVINSVLRHFGKYTIPNAKDRQLFQEFRYEGFVFLLTISYSSKNVQIICSDLKQTDVGTLIQISDLSIKRYLKFDNNQSNDDETNSEVYNLFVFIVNHVEYLTNAFHGFIRVIKEFPQFKYSKPYNQQPILCITVGGEKSDNNIYLHAVQKGEDVEWNCSISYYDWDKDHFIGKGTDPIELVRTASEKRLSESVLTEIGYTDQDAVKGLKIKDEEWYQLDQELKGKLYKGSYGLEFTGFDTRRITQSGEVYFYKDNKCVGKAELETTNQLDSTHISKRPAGWLINYIEVRPTERGKGLGKAMYKTLLIDIGMTLISHDVQSPSASKVWISLWKDPEILVYGTPYDSDGSEKWPLKTKRGRLVPAGEQSVNGMCLVAVER